MRAATAIFIFSSRPHPPNPTFCLNITSICPRGKDRPSKRGRSFPSAFPAFSSRPRNFEPTPSFASKRSFVLRRRNRKFHLNLSGRCCGGWTPILSEAIPLARSFSPESSGSFACRKAREWKKLPTDGRAKAAARPLQGHLHSVHCLRRHR